MKSLLPLIGVCLMLPATGCRVGGGQRETVQFGPDGALQARTPSGGVLILTPGSRGLSAKTGSVVFAGAIGETITFELPLRAAERGANAINVTVSPLRSADDVELPATFRMFRVHAVPIDAWPGWHIRLFDPSLRSSQVYDVVVPAEAPVGGLPAPLAAGETMVIFGELTIPTGVAAGRYAGTVLITDGDDQVVALPLHLKVWPFSLPVDNGLSLLCGIDLGEMSKSRGDGYVTDMVRLLRSHGVSPVFSGVYPISKVDRAGRLTVDWSDFDETLSGFLDQPDPAGSGARPWCLIPFDARSPKRAFLAQDTSVAVAYLRECAEHFADRGWLERSYLRVAVGPAFQPVKRQAGKPVPQGGTVSRLRHFAGLARLADRRLMTMATVFAHESPRRTWELLQEAGVAKLIDIWSPPAAFCDPSVVPGAQRTWFMVDRPPYSGTVSLAGNQATTRVLCWQARRYGIDAVVLGVRQWDRLSLWDRLSSRSNDRLESLSHRWHAGLLHSGAGFGLDQPVASMRLKHLRRGMQDVSYLVLLESSGLEHVASTMLDSLTPYALSDAYRNHVADVRTCAWPMDPNLWEQARIIMAEQLMRGLEGESLPYGRGSEGYDYGVINQSPDSVLRWSRFMKATRRLSLVVDGVRVQPTRRVDIFRVECSLTIENRARVALGGALRIAELPLGWRMIEPTTSIAPIAPMGRRRVTLSAVTNSLAWDADGVIELPIVFDTGDGEHHHTTARLCYIVSQRRTTPITIDGELSDWTGVSGNTASGFRLISGAWPGDPDEIPDTRCFISHDDQNVYFGIHCTVPAATARKSVEHGNIMRYQDTIPMGEELVEILIDPTNAGTHAPEDLYHIAIKQGGGVFEKGIGIDPPVGQRRVWAADVRYASRLSPDAWVIEISVPLDALGETVRGPQVWGINITRFNSSSQTYSTWSGARFNAYDPMSLGNLMVRFR
ncbi:MAG: hypothetical protein V3W34_06820 [Phycisphaerae bacterium]